MEITGEYIYTCTLKSFQYQTVARQFNEPEINCRSLKVKCKGYETREKLIMFFNSRYGRTSVGNKSTGVHPFDSSQGDSITNEYFWVEIVSKAFLCFFLIFS